MNRTILTILQTILVLICYQSQAFAGVYKWVDDSGQIHYTDQKNKPGAEKLSIRKSSTTKPEHAASNKAHETADRAVNDETDSKEKLESQEKRPTMVEIELSKSEKKRYCKEAKNAINSISNRGRMREIDAQGEYIYLTEKQRQKRLSAAKKKQREFCR